MVSRTKLALLSYIAVFVFIFTASQLSYGVVPIMQGMTNSSHSEIFILRKKSDQLTYNVVAPASVLAPNWNLETREREYSDWVVDHLHVSRLSLGASYQLRVLDNKQKIVDERSFKSLDLKGLSTLRFVMASCMYDRMSNEEHMWKSVIDQNPQMLLLIGDTVYADRHSDGSEGSIWNRYVETRQTLKIFLSKNLIPTLATWDDHDFGQNHALGDSPLKDKTQKIFADFFLSSPIDGFTRGPGVSSHLEAAGQQFVFMDSRSWRLEDDATRGAHWGIEQEDWMFDKLAQSRLPAWIMNGSQYFAGYHKKDAYEYRHPSSLSYFVHRMRSFDFPFVLGSGDVHFSEVMKLESDLFGFETYELTSSSIHSFTFPWHQYRHRNPRRLASTWKHNFLVVESSVGARQDQLHVKAKSMGKKNREYFSVEFDVVK